MSSPNGTSPGAERYEAARRVAFAAVQSAVERHRKRLLKLPNVLGVRPGFKFRDGWITHEPAVVVTVLRKIPEGELRPEEVIPKTLDGVPVDIAPANPLQQLRAAQGKAAARGAAALPEEEPLILPGAEAVAAAEQERSSDKGHGYRKPDGLQLKPVKGAMSITFHASPDAGWPTLKKFFQSVEHTLTIAMYDFTATHVFDGLKSALARADGTLRLNLDFTPNGQRRPGEMLEPEIVDGLTQALGDRFEFTKAAVHVLYPNAYHIKVAVRDGKAFWLSSGNWQNSNQPPDDVSRLDPAAQRKLFSSHNREWHVVVEHPALAKLYESYIKFDMSESRRVAGEAERALEPELPDMLVPEETAEFDERAAAVPVRVFKPLKIDFTTADPVRVQPLLTPDNYQENVLKLIESAEKRLYIQNQYIKPRTDSPEAFRRLYEAVAKKMADGLDVKIILRREGDVRAMIESLETVGILTDGEHLRLLTGCHNKGIIVDSETVMVGSHNWSGDGAVFNRDASLIVYDARPAAYYEKIFLHDWENRARPFVPSERGAVAVPAPVEEGERGAVPPGMMRLSWQEFFGD